LVWLCYGIILDQFDLACQSAFNWSAILPGRAFCGDSDERQRPRPDRLYQDLARRLIAELASGRYAVGDRLPAERELSAQYAVSRPTVREAVIALEVQGLVEVRVGSGAYVKRLPGKNDSRLQHHRL
jgi:DNA-binding FadR family transcriptional regulator